MSASKPTPSSDRPEFLAWERLILATIASLETGIDCLTEELSASRALLKVQKKTLSVARMEERKLLKQ